MPFPTEKTKFLTFLGGNNQEELYEILKSSLAQDHFRDNTISLLTHHLYEKNNSTKENFLNSFLAWGEKKVKKSFKERSKIASGNSIALFVALGINFFNPIAGILSGIAITGACSIAEGIPKRNIANFGHAEGHLLGKIFVLTQKMLLSATDNNALSEAGKKKLNKILIPQNNKVKNFLARIASYTSTPVVSAVEKSLSIGEIVSNIVTGALGSIIPIIPLVTVGLSKLANNLRHKSALKQAQFFEEIAEIIFDPKSWTDNGEQAKILREEFVNNLKSCDNHGKIPGEKGYHEPKNNADRKTNPKKAPAIVSWVCAKITKTLVGQKYIQDLADHPYNEKGEKVEISNILKLENLKKESQIEKQSEKQFEKQPAKQIEKFSSNSVISNIPITSFYNNQEILNFKEIINSKTQNFTEEDLNQQKLKCDHARKTFKPFILKNQEKRDEKTIYTWGNPFFSSSDHEIIYIVDDKTGKMEVIHGKQSTALIIIDPEMEKKYGARLYEINQNNVKSYGDQRNSVIENIKSKDNPNSCVKEVSATPIIYNSELSLSHS